MPKDIDKTFLRNIKLAIAFVGLNILDAALTITTMNKGGVAELNPIMRTFLGQSKWVFWIAKINLVLIFALLLLIFSKRHPQQVKRIFIILIAAMLGICVVNTISLF